jgi:hypothetical protein
MSRSSRAAYRLRRPLLQTISTMWSCTWCRRLRVVKKALHVDLGGLAGVQDVLLVLGQGVAQQAFTSNSGMCTVPGMAPLSSISKAWRMSTIVPRPSWHSSVALARLISSPAHRRPARGERWSCVSFISGSSAAQVRD